MSTGGPERATWEDFRAAGLIWWTNRFLHLLGWALVLETEDDKIVSVYPARVSFRGYTEDAEERGFKKLTKHVEQELPRMKKEAEAE